MNNHYSTNNTSILAALHDCSRHRVFIAAMMTASKSYNDIHPHAYEWADDITGGLFDRTDLLAFEREFLGWLDYDIIAASEEVCGTVQRRLYQLLESTRPAHKDLTPPCFKSLFDIMQPLESERETILGPPDL